MIIKLDEIQNRPENTLNSDENPQSAAIIYVKNWMRQPAEAASAPISANERTSISALIAYVAWNSGESEFRVERRLSDRFNIPNVTRLPADQFDTAIRYLVDGMPGC